MGCDSGGAPQLQKSIAALMWGVGSRLGDLYWEESTRLGGGQGATRGGSGYASAGGSSGNQEAGVGWLVCVGGPGEVAGKVAAVLGSQGAGHGQVEHRAGVWGHTGLETKGGDGGGMGDSLLQWLGLGKPLQHRVKHKVWEEQLVDSTRQLKLGADRSRQRTEMEV